MLSTFKSADLADKFRKAAPNLGGLAAVFVVCLTRITVTVYLTSKSNAQRFKLKSISCSKCQTAVSRKVALMLPPSCFLDAAMKTQGCETMNNEEHKKLRGS